mmetsp:Transcript_75830/g.218983  ORF Transcript_75830/g.218983 Transcript_75830/m.218983 type:complete len:276 (-) Transcript_75830:659-1486(-)
MPLGMPHVQPPQRRLADFVGRGARLSREELLDAPAQVHDLELGALRDGDAGLVLVLLGALDRRVQDLQGLAPVQSAERLHGGVPHMPVLVARDHAPQGMQRGAVAELAEAARGLLPRLGVLGLQGPDVLDDSPPGLELGAAPLKQLVRHASGQLRPRERLAELLGGVRGAVGVRVALEGRLERVDRLARLDLRVGQHVRPVRLLQLQARRVQPLRLFAVLDGAGMVLEPGLRLPPRGQRRRVVRPQGECLVAVLDGAGRVASEPPRLGAEGPSLD